MADGTRFKTMETQVQQLQQFAEGTRQFMEETLQKQDDYQRSIDELGKVHQKSIEDFGKKTESKFEELKNLMRNWMNGRQSPSPVIQNQSPMIQTPQSPTNPAATMPSATIPNSIRDQESLNLPRPEDHVASRSANLDPRSPNFDGQGMNSQNWNQESELEPLADSEELVHGVLEASPTKFNWEINSETRDLSFSNKFEFGGNNPSLNLELPVFGELIWARQREKYSRNYGITDARHMFEKMPVREFICSDYSVQVGSGHLQLGNWVFDPGVDFGLMAGMNELELELVEMPIDCNKIEMGLPSIISKFWAITPAHDMFDEMPIRGFRENDSNTQLNRAHFVMGNKVFDPGGLLGQGRAQLNSSYAAVLVHRCWVLDGMILVWDPGDHWLLLITLCCWRLGGLILVFDPGGAAILFNVVTGASISDPGGAAIVVTSGSTCAIFVVKPKWKSKGLTSSSLVLKTNEYVVEYMVILLPWDRGKLKFIIGKEEGLKFPYDRGKTEKKLKTVAKVQSFDSGKLNSDEAEILVVLVGGICDSTVDFLLLNWVIYLWNSSEKATRKKAAFPFHFF